LVGVRIFFHFSLVPNVFPNMFSTAPHFYGKYCTLIDLAWIHTTPPKD
jgi:hypothetical protein